MFQVSALTTFQRVPVFQKILPITNSVTLSRVERSDADTADHVQHVEMIIIATLVGIASVFFVIIINLLRNVRTLSSTVRTLTIQNGIQ